MADKKKQTTKGELGEATKLGNIPRQFLPDMSSEDLDARQAAMSTRRRPGGPELEDQTEEDPEEDNLVAKGFFRDRGVPPTELEEPE